VELANEKAWREHRRANAGSPYGMAVLDYAERWANMMEAEIERGMALEECAQQTSEEADTEGITLFQYGCAVSILAQVWAHGEKLRRWHNLREQLRDEGEEANRRGTVLNPAILKVGQ